MSVTDDIREAMRKAALERGLTQSEIAKRAGVKQATVSRYMTGERGKSDDFIKVLDCLGLELTVKPIEKLD